MKPEYAKPFIMATMLAALVCLLVWRYHPRTRAWTRQFFSPFEKATNKITSSNDIEQLLSKSKVELADEVYQLRQEMIDLKSNGNEILRLKEENELLRRKVHAPPRPGFRRIVAHIIDRDPAQGGRVFRIDRGASDGIKPGLAVLAGEYLVGRVRKEVSKSTATIITVIDPNCRVTARIVGVDAHGLLTGEGEEGWKSQPYCMLKNLPRDLQYKEGAEVVTSAYSTYIPPSIPIGKLGKRGESPMIINVDKLYKNAWVRPDAFKSNFSMVTILIAIPPKQPVQEKVNAPAKPANMVPPK